MTDKTFCLFHPATGVPAASYVSVPAVQRELLIRRIVRVQAQHAQDHPGTSLWVPQIAERLQADYGVNVVPRPADVMSAEFLDVYLEYKDPERKGGVGSLDVLLADPDLLPENHG